jgi:hypothetical protein
MMKEIYEAPPDYLLSVDREKYIEYLVNKYSMVPVKFGFLDWSVEPLEEDIAAERFPSMPVNARGRKIRVPVYRYHVPYTGDQHLLGAIPDPNAPVPYAVDIGPDFVSFTIVGFYNDPERIKQEAYRVIAAIKQQSQNLTRNIEEHVGRLWPEARSWYQRRRMELLEQQKITNALGVPLKKRTSVPDSFQIPLARKPIVVQPQAKRPEPVLDDSLYQEILQVVHDTGKMFERLPSTFAGKDEETLRDHFIMVLEPRFESSTTGETFNKSGKTDILIRYEKSNVFVGECKFWRGQKQHQETIDQLLSYLTWRDSKAAIIYFVNTKEVVAPLRAIEETTCQHQCFVTSTGKRDESWFDYTFHLPGDVSRQVYVSILCFHFPPAN